MSRKIAALNEEQIALIPQYVEEWVQIGLSTDPADRPEAEAGLRQAYAVAGLPPPERILWAGSILDALPEVEKLGSLMGNGVWTGTWAANLWAVVVQRVQDAISDETDIIYDDDDWDLNEVWSPDSLVYYLEGSITRKARDRIVPADAKVISVPTHLQNVLYKTLANTLRADSMAPFMALYTYCRDVLGLVEETEKIAGIERMMRSARWVLMYDKIAIFGDRRL